MVFVTLKMKNLHDNIISHHTVRNKKMFGKSFCFACISASENDKILIFFSKDAPSKALQKLYEQIPIGKQKSLRNIF
jgi:predicted peroxiredoxin